MFANGLRSGGQQRAVVNATVAAASYLLLAMAEACLIPLSPSAHAQNGPPPPSVTVANPLPRHIAQWDEYTGRFEAVERVQVRPRVTGYISEIHFTDGVIVKKGDKLFTIDPRPYEIAVDQAKADLARTQAQVQQAAVDYLRAQDLVKTAAVTVRELDQRRATLDVDRAQQMSAEASLHAAELNLEWTRVLSPITGRISDRKVTVGNLVTGAGDATLLTTIVSLDPIYFVFEGSEADYLRYTRLSAKGDRASSRDAPNPVQVRLADETAWTHNGRMNFVDNEVNTRSGTIRGRAVFDNKDFFFTPGTFGRLHLFGGMADVLMVPDAAVVSDQANKVLMTAGPDDTVVSKTVTLGGMALGLRIVESGISPSDRVIIGGLASPFVRPGAKVAVTPGTITAVEDQSSSPALVTEPAEANAAGKPGRSGTN